ncbi:hypothetical protein ACFX2I_006852 [Malus domestica]
MQIKCVCRTWRALSQDPRLLVMYQATASKRNPSLILHCDSPILNNLYFVETNHIGHHDHYANKARRIDAPIRYIKPELHIVGSCNGLLCVSSALYFNPLLVFNPLTINYIRLPNTTQYLKQQVFGFGFHPTTMEYKILEQGPAEALLNGTVHWVTTRHKHQPGPGLHIVSFDVAEEKFKEIERPGCGSLDICNFHLVVIYGCLSAVVCHDRGQIDIWVMKEYGVKESWTKEYVIRDRLFRSLSQR